MHGDWVAVMLLKEINGYTDACVLEGEYLK